MSQKTSKKTTKIDRFEKNLLVFFALRDDLIFFQKDKTLGGLHLALELETS